MTPHRFYRATFAACALIVASVIASPNLASAETHNPNETVQTSSPFGQFLVGDIVGRARGALVLREDRLAGIECDEARNVETYGVEIVSPVTMNEGDRLWRPVGL